MKGSTKSFVFGVAVGVVVYHIYQNARTSA